MTTSLPQPEAIPRPPAISPENSGARSPNEDATQLVSFRLANEEYGVDIMRVQEIILIGQITRMPEVPDFICGLINLRGHVIPIVDLRKRFGLPTTEKTEDTRIVVLNVNDQTLGIVVDAVNEVLRITSDQVEPPPTSISGIDQNYIRGLVRLENKLLIMLNVDLVLSEQQQSELPRLDASQAAK